jgi:hypothetical protein
MATFLEPPYIGEIRDISLLIHTQELQNEHGIVPAKPRFQALDVEPGLSFYPRKIGNTFSFLRNR